MTNIEKLRECFPNTIFIYRKEGDRTTALVCSDEWLESEYKAPDNRKCGTCKHHVIRVEVGDGKPPRHTSGCELWECKFEPKEPTIKTLGEELRKARKGIADEKVLIGYNMAIAICNKYLGESEDTGANDTGEH